MKKILVVDDEPDIVEMVELRLREHNFDVITATDGDQAVTKARQQNPDLILMDIMMPNMMGGDAVKLLKAYPETEKIPVIFFTGAYRAASQAEEAESVVNVEGVYYPTIGKPFDPARLLKEIHKHLDMPEPDRPNLDE